MATTQSDLTEEVRFWLKTILKDENLKDFTVNIVGNSEKGDGYMGDIVFVSVDGITENSTTNKIELVLKCSKRSSALRESTPIKETFMHEAFIYQEFLPFLTRFQIEQGIENPFNSVAKCYGAYIGDNMEVIGFENLKAKGYELWPKKQPLTRRHVDLVVTEYGKFHATSLALQLEKPVEYKRFVDAIGNLFEKFANVGDMETLFGTPVDEIADLLKDDLDEDTLARWKNFRSQIDFILKGMDQNSNGVKVILHGDCWNNNFMYLHSKDDENIPLKVAFLDWQVTKHASPIFDLSYFLFACISEEDLCKMDQILLKYHDSFINHLRRLNVKEPELLYPLDQFLNDWKSYSRYGVLLSSLLMKIVSTDKDEVRDIGEMAESGKSFFETFANDIRDKDNYKKRARPIVKYVVKHNLI